MGSYMPWVYYGFYCDTMIKSIYMAICIILGAVTMTCSVLERFCQLFDRRRAHKSRD